ncbi:MAG: hypothetical protein QOK39_2737, partial [Acidimicrobiaceae bacterium]|nr:hypothetical protein [Acidimicrobiaceae bacterium]
VGAASEHEALMGACLAAGPAAAASHRASAALWGAEQVLAGPIDITSFDDRYHRLPGVTAHRSRLDPAMAVTHRFGIPIVVAPLTVVQLADANFHSRLVTSVANDLVKRNWTTFRTILAWADLVGGRRQQALQDLCRRAIDLGGHADSPAARRMGEKLKSAGAPPFEMDYPVETPEGIVLIDYAWRGPKVGLEYNGARDHDHLGAKGADAYRRARLAALGWLMFDANSAVSHDEMIRLVLTALAARIA